MMARKGQSFDDFWAAQGIHKDDPEVIAFDRDFDQFEEFGDQMVLARREAGLTQADVAKIMRTTQSAVSELETIGRNPTIDTLQRYARALGYRLIISAEKVESPKPRKTTSSA